MLDLGHGLERVGDLLTLRGGARAVVAAFPRDDDRVSPHQTGPDGSFALFERALPGAADRVGEDGLKPSGRVTTPP
ncbi:hypothetical protein [Embleya hyalina]|uniref:hypothetical protein n=1 Tax=Embleya hyalina TaxID=516124 RepID=UPI000F818404|nr:hypothetical protein [Embleya hyalina]